MTHHSGCLAYALLLCYFGACSALAGGQPGQRWAVEVYKGMHDEAAAALEACGFRVVMTIPGANLLAVVPRGQAAAAAPAAAATDKAAGRGGRHARLRAAAARARAPTFDELRILSAPGVANVRPDGQWRRAGGDSDSAAAGARAPGRRRRRRALRRRRLRAAAAPELPICRDELGDPSKEEIVPYHVSQVGALEPSVVELSKAARDNVLFCILDSGMDAGHPDFDMSRVNGTTRRDGFNVDWSQPWDSHGTHAAGTVGALRNGFGVVGVHGAGPHMFIANVFASSYLVAHDTEILKGLELCIARADAIRAATGAPTKAVASMSLSRPESHEDFARGVAALSAARDDVLLFAAAGNRGGASVRFPAGLPEVISIAAVDSEMRHAHFSQHNSDVELCAGGAAVLSTLTANDYNHRLLQPARGFSPVSIRASPPPVQGEGAGSPLGRRAGGGPGATFAEGAASSGGGGGGLTPLFGPAPSAFEGSPLTDEAGLTAELFDCGAGAGACVGAAGKACLLMRENHTDSGQWLCQKVLHCAAAGGVAALAWPGPTLTRRGACDVVPGSLITHDHCAAGAVYPPSIGISRGQGEYLAALLAAGGNVTVRVALPRLGSHSDAYGFRSGTSMATPAAAAAAGLVWAARPGCTAAEVRAALAAAALDLGPPGRDEYYGWGLVRIKPAIDYLAAHPCTKDAAAAAAAAAAEGGGGGGGNATATATTRPAGNGTRARAAATRGSRRGERLHQRLHRHFRDWLGL